MKKIIILSTLFIYCFSAYANENFRKEKKALCELIKQEYHSWLVTQTEGYPTSDTFETSLSHQLVTTDELVTKQDEVEKVNAKLIRHSSTTNYQFSDFEFTIVNNQAIVQFTADHQLVSAFLEKENGNWKLICAARIDQPV